MEVHDRVGILTENVISKTSVGEPGEGNWRIHIDKCIHLIKYHNSNDAVIACIRLCNEKVERFSSANFILKSAFKVNNERAGFLP